MLDKRAEALLWFLGRSMTELVNFWASWTVLLIDLLETIMISSIMPCLLAKEAIFRIAFIFSILFRARMMQDVFCIFLCYHIFCHEYYEAGVEGEIKG